MTDSTPPPEHEMAAVEGAAKLVSWQCPHCHATLEVNAVRDGLPRAVGVTHQEGCPDFVPD